MVRLKNRNQTLLIAVMITALTVVFSQSYGFQTVEYVKKDVKTEQNDDQSAKEVYISLPSSNLPSSSLVELNQTMVFLFDILFEVRELRKGDFNIFLPPNGFFKTLFDGVISPNAP